MPSTQIDFATLFREHYPSVFRYVRFRVDSDSTAEDLTAEIFERAYRARDTYMPTRAAFSTWVGQIAHNWVNNYLQTRQRRDKVEIGLSDEMEVASPAESLPESQLIAKQAISRLMDCMKRLSDRDRQIVALRFGSDTRVKDIAVIMALKEHSISVMLMRAMEQLRGCQQEEI